MHTAISSGQCLYIWREKLWVDIGVNIAQSQRNLSLIVWITIDFLLNGLWVSLRLKCDEMNIRQLATFNMHNYERLHDFRDLCNLPDTAHKSCQTTILLIHAECHIFITKSKRDKQHSSCVFWHEALLRSFPRKVTEELIKGTRWDVSISIWQSFTARGFLNTNFLLNL